MTIRELQYAIQQIIDEDGVPDNSEVIAKMENGKMRFFARIRNVKFKDGSLHDIDHPIA